MSTTESASSRYSSIENWSSIELVDGIVEGQFAAIAAVQAARGDIARAIEAMAERLAGSGRIIYLGAGTSGRVAAQDGAELPPTFNWPYERAITLMAGGPGALLRAVENAEDDRDAAVAGLQGLGVGKDDVVIGIAASGNTPFVVAGLEHARRLGALTIGMLNNPGGLVGKAAEIAILLDTGAELLAGSTRMKAGTAQKAAMIALSTGVMVRLGYVYGGKMVEMRPTNAKLRERSVLMVADLTGAEPDVARTTLAQADGVIKLAVVMLARGLTAEQAQGALDAAKGNLRRALA
ncbi:N-acetylmuramic acid 6-phosphate etherase [uncultured Devosia sp.]|uniref:N-acetylmuramic acid 6-phosphate etherase n=1 Tax=uncultured Devosia sp. TaxID=211434 RepID=UPI0035CB3EC3